MKYLLLLSVFLVGCVDSRTALVEIVCYDYQDNIKIKLPPSRTSLEIMNDPDDKNPTNYCVVTRVRE